MLSMCYSPVTECQKNVTGLIVTVKELIEVVYAGNNLAC